MIAYLVAGAREAAGRNAAAILSTFKTFHSTQTFLLLCRRHHFSVLLLPNV
jgi:hypothetical protein